jgi:hypothetical protein
LSVTFFFFSFFFSPSLSFCTLVSFQRLWIPPCGYLSILESFGDSTDSRRSTQK